MLISVFVGLRYFLIFFAIVIGCFCVCLTILIPTLDNADDYSPLGRFSYFVLALRQSIGDYDTSTLTSNASFKTLIWITWFIIMIVGNIVFMNFLIAVVS